MTDTYLDKANNIRNKLNELEQFLHVVTKFDEKELTLKGVGIVLKTKVTTYLLGSRFFGVGTHKSNVKIPNSVRNDIVDLVDKRKEELEEEFRKCFII